MEFVIMATIPSSFGINRISLFSQTDCDTGWPSGLVVV